MNPSVAAVRFRGSVVTSFVSRGWPFDSLTVSREALRLKSLAQESVVRRDEAAIIEFHKQRFPLMVATYLVARFADGTVHERMFTPYRSKAVRAALRAHGWPTEERKVTIRQTLRAPHPE